MDFTVLQTELNEINERAEQIRLAMDEQRQGLIEGISAFVGTDEQTFRDLINHLSVLGQTRFNLTVMVRRPRVKVEEPHEVLPYPATE